MANLDNLAKIWAPAIRRIAPAEELRRRNRVDYALGQDGKIIASALPLGLYPLVYTWIDSGTVATGEKYPTYYLPVRCKLARLDAIVTTAPTGQDMTINMEYVTDVGIATVTIAAGESYGSTVGINEIIEPGSFLQAQVTQVGSSVAGSNLTLTATLYPVE